MSFLEVPANVINLTGRRFERLVVMGAVGSRACSKGKSVMMWLCECDCGSAATIPGHSLRSGNTRSCGCLSSELLSNRSTKHGHGPRSGRKPEYRAWLEIKRRCYNENSKSFQNYGGRGIRIADEWLWDFDAFLEHVGPRPSKEWSLDRIDNSKGYAPGNIRWATRTTQNNNSRHNRLITIGTETKTLTTWCRANGISVQTANARILRGHWTEERAVTVPVRRN